MELNRLLIVKFVKISIPFLSFPFLHILRILIRKKINLYLLTRKGMRLEKNLLQII